MFYKVMAVMFLDMLTSIGLTLLAILIISLLLTLSIFLFAALHVAYLLAAFDLRDQAG